MEVDERAAHPDHCGYAHRGATGCDELNRVDESSRKGQAEADKCPRRRPEKRHERGKRYGDRGKSCNEGGDGDQSPNEETVAPQISLASLPHRPDQTATIGERGRDRMTAPGPARPALLHLAEREIARAVGDDRSEECPDAAARDRRRPTRGPSTARPEQSTNSRCEKGRRGRRARAQGGKKGGEDIQ